MKKFTGARITAKGRRLVELVGQKIPFKKAEKIVEKEFTLENKAPEGSIEYEIWRYLYFQRNNKSTISKIADTFHISIIEVRKILDILQCCGAIETAKIEKGANEISR